MLSTWPYFFLFSSLSSFLLLASCVPVLPRLINFFILFLRLACFLAPPSFLPALRPQQDKLGSRLFPFSSFFLPYFSLSLYLSVALCFHDLPFPFPVIHHPSAHPSSHNPLLKPKTHAGATPHLLCHVHFPPDVAFLLLFVVRLCFVLHPPKCNEP